MGYETHIPLHKLLIDAEQMVRAKRLLQTAVKLLPIISPRTLDQQDRLFNFSRFSGITSRAVSMTTQCGESPYNALQLLELGYGSKFTASSAI